MPKYPCERPKKGNPSSSGDRAFRLAIPKLSTNPGALGQFSHVPISMLREKPKRNSLRMVGLKRSEEHTSELQSPCNLVCRLLLEKKKKTDKIQFHNNRVDKPYLCRTQSR